MTVATEALVISAIKFGDHSLIVKCYTKKEGLKSYLLKGILSSSKKKRITAAYFQPLSALSIIANHNNKGKLNTIKEVRVAHNFNTIYKDVKKQTIVLFISELLSQVLTEEKNEHLYLLLESSMLWLDHHTKISDFHLLFLMLLSRHLGFYPELKNMNFPYFDLNEGRFYKEKPTMNYLAGEDLMNFKKVLGIKFDAIDQVKFNHKERQKVLTILIQYYELHLDGFKKPKSLEVLKVVFS